jgi:hypothetical protein
MPTDRQLFGFVVLLTDVTPVVAKMAVTEFSSGIVPVDIASVGVDAFAGAARRCVELRVAPPGTAWTFAENRLKSLQAGHAAEDDLDEVRHAMHAISDEQAAIQAAAAQIGLDNSLRTAIVQALLESLESTRRQQGELLDDLRVGMTADFQIWETLAFMMGRALRGEFRTGHAHVRLDREMIADMLTRYLGAGASPNTVWEDNWAKQKKLLALSN